MVAKNALATVTVIPTSIQQEAGRYLSRKQIDDFLKSAKVKEKDIEPLRDDMLGLAAAKLAHLQSGLAMGQRLASIQARTTPYKGILPKIMKGFGLTTRQGYRLIASFNNAANAFPEAVLKAAMIKGLDFVSYNEKQPLGKYTDIVQRLLPPPRNADPATANKYIDQLEQTYKEKRKAQKARGKKISNSAASDIERDPKFLKRQQYRGIKNALEYIPKRQQLEWFESLVGMVMTHLGIASQKTFKPEAVPEEFDRGAGRPAQAEAEATAAVA